MIDNFLYCCSFSNVLITSAVFQQLVELSLMRKAKLNYNYNIQITTTKQMKGIAVIIVSLLAVSQFQCEGVPDRKQMCYNKVKQVVTYGSIIKLFQPHSNKWLHSHEVRFGRGGHFSVTGFGTDDSGNYWQVLEENLFATKTYSDPLRCEDVVRIKSAIIGYFLRADDTSFGMTTELLPMVHGMPQDRSDQAVNWKIICGSKEKGEQINFSDEIKLKHSVSGKYVILDPSSQYTEWNCRGCEIVGQIEIHGVESESEDEKTLLRVLPGLTFAGAQSAK